MRRFVIIALLLATVTSARADCARVWSTPGLMGPTWPAGGIVVGPRIVTEEPPAATALTLVRGRERIDLRVEQIGRSSLTRLVPARPPLPGAWTIEGMLPPNRVEIGADGPAVAPPRVSRLTYREAPPEPRRRDASLTAQLAAPVPEGVIALVAEWEGDARHAASGTATGVDAGGTEALLFQSPGRCGPGPSAEYWPYRGARARVGFVDRAGNVAWAAEQIRVR
jgi:hypothetical protein